MEMRRLIVRSGFRAFSIFLIAGVVLFCFGLFYQAVLVPGFLIIFIMSGAITCVGRYPYCNLADYGINLLTVFYIGWGFGHFILLRNMLEGMDGFLLFLFALVVIWGTDTGAYFTGTFLGKRPFYPEISAHKTVEGFIGGLVISFLASYLFLYFIPMPNHMLLLLTTPLLSALGQTGDLFESLIKRQAGVKDSSRILPGHGGILDRFDSALWVIPALYQVLSLYEKVV